MQLPSSVDWRHVARELRRPHWAWLAGASVGAAFTLSARRPVKSGSLVGGPLFVPSFFAGWLTNELVFHHFVWQVASSFGFVRAGALRHRAGWAALGLSAAQWAVMAKIVAEIRATPKIVEDAIVEALGPDYRQGLPDAERDWDAIDIQRLVMPFDQTDPGVERLPNRVFATVDGEDLQLDVFRPADDGGGPKRPCLIYVHGGGWIIRQRQYQGMPTANEMAGRGWVVVRPDYRLSPKHRFPAHLVDVKRAIAWVRANAEELGIDPEQVAIAGGSAGGHLCALAALTPHRKDLQPGFEDADTSVFAAVPIYGVFDFLNRHGFRSRQEEYFLQQLVFRTTPRKDPELFRLASPFDQVHGDAPPFMVIHGTKDSLAPYGDAPLFVEALREAGVPDVVEVSLPGAQHAFETFPSWRTVATTRGVARWLEHVRRRRFA